MCTAIRFTDDKGQMYLARNLDWSCGYGELVVVTPRGFKPNSPFGAVTGMREPVIGMGVVEEGMPLYFDCANASGLGVAGLNFPGYAQYADAPVEGKTNVAAYEFPLWVVANFTTVDEVERALDDLVIVGKPINDKYPVSLLHWIIGDATRSIVVEQTAQGMEVYHDDVDVLANQPGFAWHRENLRNYMNVSNELPQNVVWDKAELLPYGSGAGMRGIPGDYYSTSRFVRVAYLNSHHPVQSGEKANVSRMFHELEGVAMIDGAARMTNGEFERTVYTGGYSAATRTYYFNTYEDPAIRSVTMDDYDTEGTELVQVADPRA